jgi:hypothetical protein
MWEKVFPQLTIIHYIAFFVAVQYTKPQPSTLVTFLEQEVFHRFMRTTLTLTFDNKITPLFSTHRTNEVMVSR